MTDVYVYFIENRRRGLVKIGTSNDPKARLNALTNGGIDVLHLLAVVPGDERYETALHERFDALRVAGEWFRHEGELADLIALLPSVDIESRPKLNRQRIKPTLTNEQKVAVAAEYAAWMADIKQAVYEIGVTDFADAIGIDHGDLVRAMNGNGRYFRYEWWLALRQLMSTGRWCRPGEESAGDAVSNDALKALLARSEAIKEEILAAPIPAECWRTLYEGPIFLLGNSTDPVRERMLRTPGEWRIHTIGDDGKMTTEVLNVYGPVRSAT